MYGYGALKALSGLSESLVGGTASMMDNVVQYLMSMSSMEVLMVNIRNPTKDSFSISIECRVTGTGPVSSIISPMTVDLLFNGSRYGSMKLPEIHTSVWGTTILILEQTVDVSDMDAYRAYVRSTIVDEETKFRLDNGDCHIQALGLTARCKYGMDVPMVAMGGLKGEIVALEVNHGVSQAADASEICRLDVRLHNPSPVQIDHGVTFFELRTMSGDKVVARLETTLQILRGSFVVKLHGRAFTKIVDRNCDKVRLVGIGTKDESWGDETIRNVDVLLEMEDDHRMVLEQ